MQLNRTTRSGSNSPSVITTVVHPSALEADPQLRGRLKPPRGTLPPSVAARQADNGVRILSINIHGGVPGNQPLARDRERVAGLRDIAAMINAVDPDVVLVQELRDRQFVPGTSGVSSQASVLHHLMHADDMAYTPALIERESNGIDRHYGTAVFTRNGYHVDRALDVDLPNRYGAVEDRSAGIVSIRSPHTGHPFAMISTHLSAGPDVQDMRTAQLDTLSYLARKITSGSPFEYREGLRETIESAAMPMQPVVVAGDLNQEQDNSNYVRDSPDEILGEAGLTHGVDLLRAGGNPARAAAAMQPTYADRRIDHLYASAGIRVTDATVADVPQHDLHEPATDHRAVIFDLQLP